MQPINVIAELFMVSSKVQLDPERQGWAQRKNSFPVFGVQFSWLDFFLSFSFRCFSQLVVPMCLLVTAPSSQRAGVPACGAGAGGGTGGEKAKGLQISNRDLTYKTFPRFPTLTAPLS